MKTNKLIGVICLLAAAWLYFDGGGGILPSPSPVPGSGFHLLIKEERDKRQELQDKYPEKYDGMMSAEIDNMIRDAGGKKYLYDKKQDVSDKDDPWVLDAMKVPAAEYPFAVIDHDGYGTAQPWPEKLADQKALVKKYLDKD